MAQKVFRFVAEEPGIDLVQLRTEINDPTATLQGTAGGRVIDINAEETAEDDLVGAMGLHGYAFIEAAPSNSREAVFMRDVVDDALVDDITLDVLADDVTATLLVDA